MSLGSNRMMNSPACFRQIATRPFARSRDYAIHSRGWFSEKTSLNLSSLRSSRNTVLLDFFSFDKIRINRRVFAVIGKAELDSLVMLGVHPNHCV